MVITNISGLHISLAQAVAVDNDLTYIMILNILLSLCFANKQRLSTEGNTWTVSIQ